MKNKITMNGGNDNISLQEAFDEFIRIKIITNLSSESIKDYKGVFKYFTRYIDSQTLCRDVSLDTILNYVEWLKENNPNLAPTSVNTYLRHIRSICYFFMEKEYMPRFKITLIKCEKPLKEVYTDYELEQLMRKPNIKKCKFAEFRNWAIICYLLGTGNRLNTVVNVKIEDVDFDNGEIRIKTVKNRKPQIIPLSNVLCEVLQEYLLIRKGNPADYLFCNQYGEPLTNGGLKSIIAKYNQSRGVEKTSIHLFRNTFAKDWILNGGDIFRLQKILGHSSLEMVRQYVDMFGGDLKRDYSNHTALDRRYKPTKKIYMKALNKPD